MTSELPLMLDRLQPSQPDLKSASEIVRSLRGYARAAGDTFYAPKLLAIAAEIDARETVTCAEFPARIPL